MDLERQGSLGYQRPLERKKLREGLEVLERPGVLVTRGALEMERSSLAAERRKPPS